MRPWLLFLIVAAIAVSSGLAYGQKALTAALTADRGRTTLRPLAPHEATLLAIQEEGRGRVQALSEAARWEQDPDARWEIQVEISEVKRTYRLRFLEELAAGAAERGDERIRAEAQHQIELLRNPPRRDFDFVDRPHPDKNGLLKVNRP